VSGLADLSWENSAGKKKLARGYDRGMATRRSWNEDTVNAELAPIVAELGRMPKRDELAARGLPGLWNAMRRYGGITVWKQRMTAAHQNADRATTHDEIARRAYHIALERGGGDPIANWLDAERELVAASRG
jgi:hypothetical protein